jgi:hypothetical protein
MQGEDVIVANRMTVDLDDLAPSFTPVICLARF